MYKTRHPLLLDKENRWRINMHTPPKSITTSSNKNNAATNLFIKKVALEYLKSTNFNNALIVNWNELREYNYRKFDLILRDIKVQLSSENPYRCYKEMRDDINMNRTLKIYTGNCVHPLWSREDNYIFRAVHDYYGHYLNDQPFTFLGELRVFLAHIKDMTHKAQVALMTELIGELCYYFYFHQYVDSHKICNLHYFYRYIIKII